MKKEMNKKVSLKMSEPEILIKPEVNVKIKNPKRIEAGKNGAEAKTLKAELRKKEEELLKKENIKLKMDKEDCITKEEEPIKIIKTSNIIKPLCLSAVVISVGFYLYKNNQVKEVKVKPKEMHKPKEIDSFEFN